MQRNRNFFATTYCVGRGIEIGALHFPVSMPPGTKVRYVDRMSTRELRGFYQELKDQDLVEVEVIDDGESLATFPDGEEDFVFAGQFIEHCRNPVRSLVNMLRVVRNHGYVVLTVPDKRLTFDKQRPITTNEHLLEECLHGCDATERDHFREYARLVDGTPDEILEARVDWHMQRNTSIHYHVWDAGAFMKFLLFFKERFQLPFEIYATLLSGNELIAVLQKRLNGP